MHLPLLLGLALVLGALIQPLCRYALDRKSLRRFPSPSLASFTPFWMIWQNWNGRRFLAVDAAHRTLGSVVRIGPESLSFSDPVAYKDIYGHGSSIIKDTFYDNLAGDTPSIADTSSRELHSLKRRNLSSIFSAKNIVKLEPKVKRAVKSLLVALRCKADGGVVSASDHYHSCEGQFDLRPWMNMFSFDAFSSMLWSSTYGFLERGNDDCLSLDAKGNISTVNAMHCFQTGIHFSTMCAQLSPPAYRFARWVSQKLYRKRAADYFTGMARYKTVVRLEGLPDEVDFFSFFPLQPSEKRMPMELSELVAECATFLNAGNDTTQISLTNAIFELACHPLQQEKLHNVLTEALPRESQPIASYGELAQIPYLRACLDETFRLLPPVRFGIPRRTVAEGATIAGHYIGPNVTVSSSVYTLHRNENLFHQALAWIPERWLPGETNVTETESRNLKEFVLPFTLGGRACIGRNLAYMELSICLAAMVMSFEWSISEEVRRTYLHFERLNSSPVSLMVSARPRTDTWTKGF